MEINIIHVSDIHLGSGESHGRLNPSSGVNTRFEDFVQALKKVVDYTLEQKADVFLFTGDAYRNASPEPLYQKAFASALKRLSDADVKTILLVGNHDLILRSTASHSMSVFQSLQVPHVTVIDAPGIFRLDTMHGAIQIVGLPYVVRHHLIANEEFANLSQGQVDKTIIEKTDAVLKGFYQQLDPKIPAIACAHMTVDKAVAGIEKELLVGYTLTFPVDIFVDSKLNYVALGHVHKHQVIRQSEPAIVYSGSLERIDFGEEKEDKGFMHVKLVDNQCQFQFHSISPRPFVTVDCDLTKCDAPTEFLHKQIQEKIIDGCVLRIRYKIKQEDTAKLDFAALDTTLTRAMSARLIPEVVFGQRLTRLPELSEAAVLSPISALDTYLEQVAPDRKANLIDKAKKLLDD